MKRVKLSELVDKVSKWNPRVEAPNSSIQYIDIASINRASKLITEVSDVLGKNAPSRARQLVKVNDILVSTVRPNLNSVAYVPQEFCGATCSTGFCVLRATTRLLDSRYLFHWVQTKYFVDNMISQATGASYPAVTDAIVKSSTIPLPPLDEQKRIAAILDKADSLRVKRRAALAKLDALVQSVFLEMFGDPVTNPMGWEVRKFGDVCDTRLGKMLDAKQQTGKHLKPYLRNANVKWDYIDTADLAEMDFDDEERQKFQLHFGDLLICEGGEVGRTAIWQNQLGECYFQKALHRARANVEIVLPEYMLFYMWFMAKHHGLDDHTTSATIAHLTGVKIKKLDVPLPPLTMQIRFKEFRDKLNQRKRTFDIRLDRSDNLFHSLQQRAFRGEL